jgi:hypothetical protein
MNSTCLLPHQKDCFAGETARSQREKTWRRRKYSVGGIRVLREAFEQVEYSRTRFVQFQDSKSRSGQRVRGSRCEVGYVATDVDTVDSTVDGKERASYPN